MWTIAHYEPTGLFSLRPALSTASGAQSLLVPTPFAVKMALLDVAIHLYGVEQGATWWPDMRDLAVALALPDALVVNKTFIKIQRKADLPKQKGVDKDEYIRDMLAEGRWPLGPTIAFREFVQFSGILGVAVQPHRPSTDLPLARLLAHITYLVSAADLCKCKLRQHPAPTLVKRGLYSPKQHSSLQSMEPCKCSMTAALA